VVGVGFGEGDLAGGGDGKGGGDGETPGVGALIAVDEGDVDHDGAVVLLHWFGNGVGDVEGVGEDGTGVGEEGIGEVVVLGGEVVLAGELRGDGDQERALFADGGEGGLPGLELSHAVGAPAAAEEDDDERADAEEVGGMNQAGVGGGCVGERGGGGVGEVEGGGEGAEGEDAVFDACEEEGLHCLIRDGKTAGLDQGAGLGGDVVELGLEVGGMRHWLNKCRCSERGRRPDGSEHRTVRVGGALEVVAVLFMRKGNCCEVKMTNFSDYSEVSGKYC
jgi:hypothetical protein